MPNSRYRKGRQKERDIVNEARGRGLIAARSAGSKSIIDVFVIDFINKKISLIQSKAGESCTESLKKRLEEKNAFLNGTYEVLFKVL